MFGIASPQNDYASRTTLASVSLNAEHVELDVPHLLFDGTTIVARSLELSGRVQTVDGLATLAIWPEPGFELKGQEPVKSHIAEALEGGEVGAVDAARFERKLSQMLSWFPRHGYGTYAMYETRFNTVITKKNRDRLALGIAAFLMDRGALKYADGLVYLDPGFLEEYSIHYRRHNDVRFGDPRLLEKLHTEWRHSLT